MSPGKRRRVADVVRRQRTPRLDAISVLALVIPLVTVGVLALVRQPPVHDRTQGPALTALTQSTVVCPAAGGSSPDAWVSTDSGTSGSVTVLSGHDRSSAGVSTGKVAGLSGTGALVLRGTGDLAPGLVGLRAGTAPLTTQTCSVPTADQWFTGLGAGASHDSVIELVNPDSGPANADITLYGSHPFTARKLHGITIPARRTVSLDLGAIVPRRQLMSAQVQVTRGRLAAHVLDATTSLLTHKVRREWLPRQVAPAPVNRLLGLPAGAGSRSLRLVNPGDDVVRAEVRIITGDTAFAPAGLGTVSVPAGATTSVPLTKVLATALGDGAIGVEVTADGPLAASVLTDLGTDQAFTVPDTPITQKAVALLPTTASSGKGAPPVKATLYLDADSAGSTTVTAYDATGAKVMDQRVGQQQGHTADVALPPGTAYVRVEPQSTTVRGAVLLTGDGASVVPLQELLTRGLVPAIQPGLN